MKVIVAGSRGIQLYQTVADAMDCAGFVITEVVSGTARGVDRLGERWAIENDVPIKRFPANWDRYGRSAGYLRNEQMAQYADGLIAVWDGHSRGTIHMINLARKQRLAVYVHDTSS
jgi:hypothetical protein